MARDAPDAEKAPASAARTGAAKSGAAKTDAAKTDAGRAGKMAGRARVRRRHHGLALSLIVLVVLPVVLAAAYLWTFAQDQYASTAGFTIRQEETGAASQLLGGLTQLVGGGSSGNSDLLFEFIQSQEIVEAVNDHVDLVAHYSATWPADPVFSIWPGATIEDMLWFWKRMVRITYDRSSGLIMVEARARDPDTAQAIARAVVAESEAMINMLNEAARRDSMANAQLDLEEALERLRAAREAIAEFRARTQIIDPAADIQGRMGVLNNLQQQLAQALVDYDLLLPSADSNDPRLRNAERRITVIRDRITEERRSFAAQDVTVDNTDYPSLLAQYESLRVDQEFSEENYRAALTALEQARSNAERQQIYLATFVRPTLAQRADYPRRLLLVGLTAFFALMTWAVLALVYYSLRDRG
ncbi:sugar transporter [Rhabdonatronobacter sediminivivens]|uniref:sugar transporter n=1 Tax=Rhabdonatronobacter sediminivivens TaxID=2743469 RepID=UPI001F2027AA|nr:sugar transporter [Rhabdonatronobacter sediminivivens]